MEKKIFVLSLIIVLFAAVCSSTGFSEERQTRVPALSETSLPAPAVLIPKDKTSAFLTAQNAAPDQEEDPFEGELFEEYDDAAASQTVADPFYYFNGVMFSLNDFLYVTALEPIAIIYKTITPTVMRKGIKNFFHNIFFPIRLVNNILQGQIKNAGTEVKIFSINSTIGILGFRQVAQNQFNLHTANEDLGQTLGTYSIGNGFYLFFPVLGPSTLRDTLGMVGDSFLNPINYVNPWELSTGIKAYNAVNSLSFRIGEYETLKESTFDPYVAVKQGYIQRRKKKVQE